MPSSLLLTFSCAMLEFLDSLLLCGSLVLVQNIHSLSEGPWNFKVLVLLKLCILYFIVGICEYFNTEMRLKVLLHQAIFPATCLAILLHKLHEILPSVTCQKCLAEFYFSQRLWQQNCETLLVCYTRQYLVQLVSQQNCKTSCWGNCLV